MYVYKTKRDTDGTSAIEQQARSRGIKLRFVPS